MLLGRLSQSRLWPAPTHKAHILRTYEDSKDEKDMLFARHMVHEHLIYKLKMLVDSNSLLRLACRNVYFESSNDLLERLRAFGTTLQALVR